MNTDHSQLGFTPIITLVAVFVIFSASIFIYQNQTISKKLTPIVTPYPIPANTPTPLPSTSQTPAPQSLDKVGSPSTTPTPKPTITPPSKPVSNTPPGAGYSNITINTPRGNFNTQILVLDGPKMFTDTASDGNCDNDCPVKSLADFATQNGAFAGINGTYFCPDTYPECQSKKNTFDFPVYNSRLNHWINEDKLFWDNRALIYQDGSQYHFVKNAKDFHGSLSAGIANYPALLDHGNPVVGDYALSDKQKTKGTKVGLGLNGNRVYIVLAQNVDMDDFAATFKSLGALDALNLDTGGSTAFWLGGRYLAGPGRNLPNAVLFK